MVKRSSSLWCLEASSPNMFFSDLTVTRLSANYTVKALIPTEGEKNHNRGGVELCFWKLLLLRSEELFSGSESE